MIAPLLLTTLWSATAAAGPAVAVMTLEAKTGVAPDVAELLSTAITNLLRDDGRFGRVIGTKELDSLLGYERQKMVLSCDSSSCLAEMAGALGADYVLTGSVGRLGTTWVLSFSLLDTHDAQRAFSAMRNITGGAEDVLLKAIPGMIAELLQKTGIIKAGQTAAAPAVAAPSPEPAPVAAAAPTGSKGPLGMVLKGVGGAGMAGGVLAALLGVGGGLAASGVWLAVFLAPNDVLGANGRGFPVFLAYYGLWGACALGLLVGIALGVGGAGALAGGLVAG